MGSNNNQVLSQIGKMLAKYQEKRDINYQAWMHKTKKISFILVVDDFVQLNIT